MDIEDPRVIYSIQAALVFLVIASPFMYNLVQSILGRLVTVAKGGCPTMAGLLLHTVVYGLIVYGLMLLAPKKEEPVVVVGDSE